MHRVVIDTNVVISSIFWKNGNPHRIALLAIGQKIQNFTSQYMTNEMVKVLIFDFKQPDEFVERQLNLLLAYSEIVESEIKIKAKDAYGERDERMVASVLRDKFPPEIEVGGRLVLKGPQGQSLNAIVSEVKQDSVVIDLNHPLAGKDLNFKVKVVGGKLT